MLEKIYSNMSACHIKKNNWKRAVETADKVNLPPLSLAKSLSLTPLCDIGVEEE